MTPVGERVRTVFTEWYPASATVVAQYAGDDSPRLSFRLQLPVRGKADSFFLCMQSGRYPTRPQRDELVAAAMARAARELGCECAVLGLGALITAEDGGGMMRRRGGCGP